MFKNIIFDMDGVLWRGDSEINDLDVLFDVLEKNGVNFALATNNSTKKKIKYVEKLAKFDVEIKEEQVFSSGSVSADYLAEIYPKGTRAFVIGEDGLRHFMKEAGFILVDDDAEIVIAGLDYSISYEKIKKASREILYNHAVFYGTNADVSFPTNHGLAPGAGAILAPIITTSGVEPFCIGKPRPTIYNQVLDFLGSSPEETLMIGDRVDTDVIGAQEIGIKTALVLSGVATLEEAEHHIPKIDYIAKDLASLISEMY